MKHRLFTLSLATALAAVPAPSEAIAPALLFMIKQIAQDVATSMIKDAFCPASAAWAARASPCRMR